MTTNGRQTEAKYVTDTIALSRIVDGQEEAKTYLGDKLEALQATLGEGLGKRAQHQKTLDM